MGANTRETKHVDFRDANEQLIWLGPGRFHLSGTGTIVAPPELARTLRKYGRQVDGPVPRHDNSVFIEYKVEIDYEIEGDTYKVRRITP